MFPTTAAAGRTTIVNLTCVWPLNLNRKVNGFKVQAKHSRDHTARQNNIFYNKASEYTENTNAFIYDSQTLFLFLSDSKICYNIKNQDLKFEVKTIYFCLVKDIWETTCDSVFIKRVYIFHIVDW